MEQPLTPSARVPQPQHTPARQGEGPVELDPSLFALVAGGISSPRGTWSLAAGSASAKASPRGTWL